MPMIINFPNSNERDWFWMEAKLRDIYKTMPDGSSTLEECLPAIRAHWKKIFVPPLSVQPTYQIPGPVTEDQNEAIIAAIEKGVQLVVKHLMSERASHFGLLVVCEYKAAYFRRNGEAV